MSDLRILQQSYSNVSIVGTVTTVTSLYSLVLLLINHKEIQKKAQTEIDDVIGARSPSLADRSKCHYVEAMLMELLRLVTRFMNCMTEKYTLDIMLISITFIIMLLIILSLSQTNTGFLNRYFLPIYPHFII